MAKKATRKQAKTTQPTPEGEEPTPESGDVLTIQIGLPLVPELGDAYQTDHLDFRLTGDAKRGLRRLRDGLHAAGETLANGRPVDRPEDALRYLLENLEQAAQQQ